MSAELIDFPAPWNFCEANSDTKATTLTTASTSLTSAAIRISV